MENLKKLYIGELGEKPYFTTNIPVRWEEMDANGHINYANYLNYFSEARLDAIGHDIIASLRSEGIGPVIYKVELEYINEMMHPDTAHIVTWLDCSISKTRVSVRQNLYSITTHKLISKATFYSIFMNTIKRKPVKMPEPIREKFGLK